MIAMQRLTREQVRTIDRLSVERYGIPGIVLMENAARAATDVAWEMLGGQPGRVLILCGGGNNGGDGLAVARHLHNRGAEVELGLLVDPAKYKGDALTNWNIIRAMGMPARPFDPTTLANGGVAPGRPARPLGLIVDAIFGTGLDQVPRDPFADVANAVNLAHVQVLAIDLPSGLDCETGKPLGACIKAARTVTFVAEKVGFGNTDAEEWLGQVTVGDIGCPRELVAEVAPKRG
jgi:NAD(P)H-hydrate epimerase